MYTRGRVKIQARPFPGKRPADAGSGALGMAAVAAKARTDAAQP